MTWDDFYMGMARYVASKSKDPSTKVGAVIVRPDNTVASLGYNGFPSSVVDDPRRAEIDRDWKLARTIHAEMNALIAAREPLNGYTIYTWPLPPCSHCAAALIQAGIARVVAPDGSGEHPRWVGSLAHSVQLYGEAHVALEFV